MNSLQQAANILQTLERQEFADWYHDTFEDYIGGVVPRDTISYEEQKRKILADIVHMFKL